jgi:hypothetical protein
LGRHAAANLIFHDKPPGNLLTLQRLWEHETLSGFAIGGLKQLKLLLFFHTIRNHIHSDAFGQRHNRVHDLGVFRLALPEMNERSIFNPSTGNR